MQSNGKVLYLVISAAVLLTAGGALLADTIDWHGKTLALTVYPRAKLEIDGAASEFVIGMTGGVLGSGDSAGAKLQADSTIEDPALRVARSLFAAAKQHYDVVAAPDVSAPPLANPKQLVRLAQGVDLLLDISSTSSVVKRPFNSRYWVNTNMSGRVIDVHTGKVHGDSFCQIVGGGDPDPLTYEELVANNAARLKATLSREADSCLEKFMNKLLGVPSSSGDRKK